MEQDNIYPLMQAKTHFNYLSKKSFLLTRDFHNYLLQGDNGWKFYLHHPLEVPTLGVQTHGTSLYPGQGRDLRLDLKKASESTLSPDSLLSCPMRH